MWQKIYDDSDAFKLLEDLAKNPVNSYIFSGPPAFPTIDSLDSAPAPLLRYGARKFAADLFHNEPELAYQEAHPNLRMIEPEGRTFRVDDVEAVIREVSISPKYKQDKKVIVCDRFHTADENTATRLLKVIEEPPEHSIIILLAEEKLPATIVSRCVEAELEPLKPKDIKAYIQATQAFDDEQAELIANGSDGDLGRAYFLTHNEISTERLELWNEIPLALNGTGAKVAEQVAKIRDFLDKAIIELGSTTEGAGEKADESLKREKRKIRDIEIKFGLSVLAQHYRTQIQTQTQAPTQTQKKIKTLNQAGNSLRHNPNESALLTSLLFALSQ